MKKTPQIFPPPSPRHIANVKTNLGAGNTVDTAAALAGVPQRVLLFWIEQGKRGEPEFVEFLSMIEEANTALSKLVLEDIYQRAFKDRELAAVQFLYKNRLQRGHERFAKKVEEMEDRIEADAVAGVGTVHSEEDLAALEEKLSNDPDARH